MKRELEEELPFWLRMSIAIALWLALVAGCCWLCGCNTVAPVVAKSSQASFDAGVQDSGLIAFTADGRAIITPHARDRYEALTKIYGQKFTPALTCCVGIEATSTNTFLIDAEHLADFAAMVRWNRQKQTPNP